MTGRDDRRDFRLELNLPVRYRFGKKLEPGKYRMSPPFKGIGDNFSGGGAAIIVGKPIPAKTLVYLEITFPYSPEPFLVSGEVVRLGTKEIKGRKASLIMVRYLLYDALAHEKMVGFIISHGRTTGRK